MGHVLVGQTSDTCVPFAVVSCANHQLPYVTYSAEWCRASSATSCPFHLPLLASIFPKKIFTQELEGIRQRGRHRKGWREEVERDLQVLGVRRWRELVIDREKWRGIVRQAKAHSGL